MCPALPDYFTFSQGPNKRFFKNPLISIKLNNSIFLAEALFSNSIFTRQKKKPALPVVLNRMTAA